MPAYTASQVPLIQAVPAPPSISACTDTTTTAGTTTAIGSGPFPNEISQKLNQFMANTASAFAYSGGFCVCNGLTLSTVASLALPVAAGNASILGTVQYAGGAVTVPDNTSLVFIWLYQNGTLNATTTTTPPTTNCVYIGNCTTSSGWVTAVDYTGVPYGVNGGIIRFTNDRSAPADTPNAGTMYHTVTQAGTYHWNGTNYNALTGTSQGSLQWSATLTGTLQLLPQDSGTTAYLIASGGNQTVLLPNPLNVGAGWSITLVNNGGSNNLILKDYSNTTTCATLTTTNVTITPYTYKNSSGNVVFPGGTPWSAGAFPSPSAMPA